MLDIGFLELMLIGIVALLVLGPERLPKAARTAGLWIGKIKRTVSGMQREISAQLEAEELRQKLNEQQKKLARASSGHGHGRRPPVCCTNPVAKPLDVLLMLFSVCCTNPVSKPITLERSCL